jgi:hypothetical protein
VVGHPHGADTAQSHTKSPPQGAPAGLAFLPMVDRIDFTPQLLREEAERNFRLAVATFDAAIHDGLMACCQELLDRARRTESAAAAVMRLDRR